MHQQDQLMAQFPNSGQKWFNKRAVGITQKVECSAMCALSYIIKIAGAWAIIKVSGRQEKRKVD